MLMDHEYVDQDRNRAAQFDQVIKIWSILFLYALTCLQDIKTTLNLNFRRERDKEKSAEIAQGLCHNRESSSEVTEILTWLSNILIEVSGRRGR